MNTEEKLEFRELQILSKQNTENIRDIMEMLKKLESSSINGDGKIFKMISELKESSISSKHNQELILSKIATKTERLKIVEDDLKNKVHRKEFEKLINRLWSIGGATVGIILAMLGYLIKLQLDHH